jgi:chloramphenicol-sensitive protein RarD
MRRGIVQAALAYVCWGLFPLYFKALQPVPPLEILAHRVLWSLLFLLAILSWQRRFGWLPAAFRDRRTVMTFMASSTVIALNWFIYIWAVTNDRVVEGSLGYFINPLVIVLVGALFLHERLRRAQWMAVALAALGVLWLSWQGGHPPWIALALACSFSSYGLLRKIAPLGALEGLAMETLLLGPLAVAALGWWGGSGQMVFAQIGPSTQALVVAAGPITAIPLLLFAAGARRIPFSLLGLLQYIGPTLQLLLGVLLFGEAFGPDRAIGFALIWAALALYSLESWWCGRRGQST